MSRDENEPIKVLPLCSGNFFHTLRWLHILPSDKIEPMGKYLGTNSSIRVHHLDSASPAWGK